MARLILLDSGPLGMIVRAPQQAASRTMSRMAEDHPGSGAVVVIPEIAHYEVRRELLASAQSEACDVSITLSIQAAVLTTWP